LNRYLISFDKELHQLDIISEFSGVLGILCLTDPGGLTASIRIFVPFFYSFFFLYRTLFFLPNTVQEVSIHFNVATL